MDVVSQVTQTLYQEFADLPDAGRIVRVTVRMLLAAFLGGVLGFERSRQRKAAGLRTHMLVALGSAIFVLVPLEAGASIADVTRVLQGVIAGIGFLCAGTILKREDGDQIKGLTTAAGAWMTAAIGVTVGIGHQATAVLCTLLAFVILSVLWRVECWFEDRDAERELDRR